MLIGAGLQSLLELGIGKLTEVTAQAMETFHVNEVLQSLVIDGIFHGVGSVLSFLPIIVTLFFFLSMLEDSGYMASVAFIMDKLLRKMGLSGQKYCAASDRIWMYGTRCYGKSYTSVRA